MDGYAINPAVLFVNGVGPGPDGNVEVPMIPGPQGPQGPPGEGSFSFINKPGVEVKTWISEEIFTDVDGKFVVDYSDAQFEGILDFSIKTFKATDKKGAYFIYSQLHGDYTNTRAEGDIFVVKNDGFLMFGKNRLEDKLAKVIVKVTGY